MSLEYLGSLKKTGLNAKLSRPEKTVEYETKLH